MPSHHLSSAAEWRIKSTQPSKVLSSTFEGEQFLFINSEGSSLVFVYRMISYTEPEFYQVLPAGVGPEGGLAIPNRGLYIVASHIDSRSTGVRSSINIYHYGSKWKKYPTLVSANRSKGSTKGSTKGSKSGTGTPIPFSSLSGLAAEIRDRKSYHIYSVEDSFFNKNRIFTIDSSSYPAVIEKETRILDSQNLLINVTTYGNFSSEVRRTLVNSDKTVNLDLEGIAVASDGGFWVVSEGAGNVGDASTSLNLLIKLDKLGVIRNVTALPNSVNDIQVRYGFEGVAEGTGNYTGNVLVIFQRAWGSELNNRLGWYNVSSGQWKFFYYQVDVLPTVRNSGWVGLTDVAPLCDAEFLIMEGDNQAGPDAQVKRLYKIDLENLTEYSIVNKTLVYDLLPPLQKTQGLVLGNWEGVALNARGSLYIVNDNGGIDRSPSEMQMFLVTEGGSLKSQCY